MVAQLRVMGEEVGLLVLLDAVNHACAHQAARLKAVTRGRASVARANSAEPSFGDRIQAAALRHRPAPFRGDVLLLRAADAERGCDGASGWVEAVKGRLTIVDLPGDDTAC